ncbi:FtsK/SpoIIIE domain-containing protein [Streptomyces alkaliphilus]|uniref:FtsK/SpoIIIE domain-containing protein n=1 Tax=Streptomyces alkaliphilus TaxID=1472722 RepID=UPI00117FCA9F|nr:FtsK/SpoIIIE domain-containing protein [Streptomyces alkaliphilus]MQS06100.1 cell division protein FtsK [Streptomyces alkaliphilus]
MNGPILLAFALAVVAWAVVLLRELREQRSPWYWYLTGYPVTALRVLLTWRRVAQLNDLGVTRKPARRLVGDVVVRGAPLRPAVPLVGFPRPLSNGLAVRVRLRPGQTPEAFVRAADALVHAWRVHSVRVISPERGFVLVTAVAIDPLTRDTGPVPEQEARLLAPVVGVMESGREWVMDFRRVPHWLIVGATRSGKSTLLARLVVQLAPQPVALVAVDCKGGMELGLFGDRLSVLATSRGEAIRMFSGLVAELGERMAACRIAGARSVWELPASRRPVPVVVLVDELAELYLTDGSRDARAEAEQCSTYLLRLAQLGAALGIHLVIAGQRVGSDLGPGVTALRAQLGGRICHRVHDPGTAEMVLGDLNKDAVLVAQSIGPAEQGVAVTTSEEGGWVRARSHLTSPETVRGEASRYRERTPVLSFLSDREGGEEE